MSMIPMASFLAGALLSMLMPVTLLICLAVWHARAVRRVPGGDASHTLRAAEAERVMAANPGRAGVEQATGVELPPGEPPAGTV